MAGRVVLPDNSIFLTFDDGYLDNWVHVFPILKKYEMKGTIFVSPDFVDPGSDIRPNLDDVWAGKCRRDELTIAGFLNWAEMRLMEESGLVDVQSHAMTHTWYFSGPRIGAFHQPHEVTPYPWLFWNARPDRKSYYLTEDQQEFLPWGYPILEHQKSLAGLRYFPKPEVVDDIVDFVAAHGGRDFFRTANWRHAIVHGVPSLACRDEVPGVYETEAEKKARVAQELGQSKTIIEANLGKTVEYICWPGGANNELVRSIARSVGYKSWTLGSMEERDKLNVPGEDPSSIRRIGTSNEIRVKGRLCGNGDPTYQLWRIMEHQGSTWHSAAVKLKKLTALARSLGMVKQ
jgi:peptidoglycan/xylan/chitin deacetylase (PgdA/CDA1 family)